jgi:hypothetical protein
MSDRIEGPHEDDALPWEVADGSGSLAEAVVLARPRAPGGARTVVAKGSRRTCEFIAEAANRHPSARDGGGFVLLHVWGDQSGICSGGTEVVPPDGRLLSVGIPNSDDVLLVVRRDLLTDQGFLDEWIPDFLHDECREHG